MFVTPILLLMMARIDIIILDSSSFQAFRSLGNPQRPYLPCHCSLSGAIIHCLPCQSTQEMLQDAMSVNAYAMNNPMIGIRSQAVSGCSEASSLAPCKTQQKPRECFAIVHFQRGLTALAPYLSQHATKLPCHWLATMPSMHPSS